MANLVRKLFKNKSTQRFIVSLKSPQHQHQQQLPKISPSLIPQQTHHFSLTNPEFLSKPYCFLNSKALEKSKSTEPLKLHPNFPFGYLLNPISSSGFDPLEALEVVEEAAEAGDADGGKVWADSVKKKRKKKMNKHKYKKLRKRLRRKT